MLMPDTIFTLLILLRHTSLLRSSSPLHYFFFIALRLHLPPSPSLLTSFTDALFHYGAACHARYCHAAARHAMLPLPLIRY